MVKLHWFTLSAFSYIDYHIELKQIGTFYNILFETE